MSDQLAMAHRCQRAWTRYDMLTQSRYNRSIPPTPRIHSVVPTPHWFSDTQINTVILTLTEGTRHSSTPDEDADELGVSTDTSVPGNLSRSDSTVSPRFIPDFLGR
jgi:hypothetical protein